MIRQSNLVLNGSLFYSRLPSHLPHPIVGYGDISIRGGQIRCDLLTADGPWPNMMESTSSSIE